MKGRTIKKHNELMFIPNILKSQLRKNKPAVNTHQNLINTTKHTNKKRGKKQKIGTNVLGYYWHTYATPVLVKNLLKYILNDAQKKEQC